MGHYKDEINRHSNWVMRMAGGLLPSIIIIQCLSLAETALDDWLWLKLILNGNWDEFGTGARREARSQVLSWQCGGAGAGCSGLRLRSISAG